MAIAQVIDIQSHRPISKERYLIDTNVWVWTTYAAIRAEAKATARSNQVSIYPRFIEDAINSGAILCHTPLMLCELANVVENIELEIYNEKNVRLTKKEFRKRPDDRRRVIKFINLSIQQVKSMSVCVNLTLDENFSNNSISLLATTRLDAYDAFMATSAKNNGIDYLVTDDSDYCDIPKLILVTGNSVSLRS